MRPAEARAKKIVGGIVATLIVFTLGGWLYLRLGYADLRVGKYHGRQ